MVIIRKFISILSIAVCVAVMGSCSSSSPPRKIAFRSTREDGKSDIFIMNEDGSNREKLETGLTNHSYPIWSSHGQRLMFYFVDKDNTSLKTFYVYDIEEDELSKVMSIEMDDWGLDWSPDGKRIVFIQQSLMGDIDIKIMDIEGGDVNNIFSGMGYAFSPVFSPDGQHLLFSARLFENRNETHNVNIYAIDVYGDNFTRLTDRSGQGDFVLDPILDLEPDWLPDQSGFVYVAERRFREEIADGIELRWVSDIIVSDITGENTKNLTNAQHPERNKSPDLSPDGKKIVFLSNRDHLEDPDIFDIYIMNLDGTQVVRLTSTGGFSYPSWQP